MAKRNARGREIWFQRWMGSYMPCHPVGIAVIVGLAAFVAIEIDVGQFILEAMGVQGGDSWSYLLILPTVIFGLVLAERHS